MEFDIKYQIFLNHQPILGEITLDTDRYNEIRLILADQFQVYKSHIEIINISPVFSSYGF